MKKTAVILAFAMLTGCANLKLQCAATYQTDNIEVK